MTDVVISNVYPDDNRGSAALTSAAITLVKTAVPNADITVLALAATEEQISTAFRHTRAVHPEVRILPTPLKVNPGPIGGMRTAARSIRYLNGTRPADDEGLHAIRGADLVVSRGGVIFRRRSLRSLAGLWRTAFPLVFASRNGTPTITMPTHFGPFDTWASRALNGLILRDVDVVVARDVPSADWARAAGVPNAQTVTLPDSVFALQSPSQQEVSDIARRYDLTPSRFGCVSVSLEVLEQAHCVEFMKNFGQALKGVLAHGIVDKIAVVVQVDGPIESDRAASEQLMEVVGDDGFELISDDLAVRELSSLYGAARFTSGTRLHAAILSLLGGTPAFPVDLGQALGIPKARPVFSTLGLRESVLEFPNATFEQHDLLEQSLSASARIAIEGTVRECRKQLVEGMVPIIQSGTECR